MAQTVCIKIQLLLLHALWDTMLKLLIRCACHALMDSNAHWDLLNQQLVLLDHTKTRWLKVHVKLVL